MPNRSNVLSFFEFLQLFFTHIWSFLNVNGLREVSVGKFPKTIFPLAAFKSNSVHKTILEYSFISDGVFVLTAHAIESVAHVNSITN